MNALSQHLVSGELNPVVDIWHGVKKQWCLEARRLAIARQTVQ
jgi:hypothetical protein